MYICLQHHSQSDTPFASMTYSNSSHFQSCIEKGLYIIKMDNQKREVKILISCDCQGRMQSLMSKVALLHQKTQFDLILLSGQVCHPRSSPYFKALREKSERLPIPAYFIDNSELSPVLQKVHPEGAELAPDLHFLGNYGVTKVKEMVIAYFSINSWDKKAPDSQHVERFLELCKGKRIDILMTNDWSKEIKAFSKKQAARSEDYVSKLAAMVNPHYHIAAGGNGFFRMPSYTNSQGFQTHFISIAPFQQNPKDKYLFGLTVKPGQEEYATANSNPIQNPYINYFQTEQSSNIKTLNVNPQKKRQSSANLDDSQSAIFFQGFPDWSRSSDITQFFQRWGDIKTIQVNRQLSRGAKCGLVRFQDPQSTKSCLASSQKVMFHTTRIKFTRRALRESKRNEDCWFCKSKGDESLIIYTGKYCYVSLEKGPLARFHLQIIPFNHVQTIGRLEMIEQEEVEHCMKVISGYFTQNGFEVIEYQRYLPLSQAINHIVLHIVPIKDGKLLKKFQQLNSKDNLGFKQLKEQFRKSQFFIKVKVSERPFIKEINKKDRVQADFMRIVISQLLDNPRLVNWKQCIRTEEEIREVRNEMERMLKGVGLIEQE